MRLKTRKLLARGRDVAQRANVEIGPSGPKISFSASARKIVDDVFIDFQSRFVLYEDGELELPERVERSLQEMRRLCVQARKELAGDEPALSEPLDRIAQACGRFVSRHPAVPGPADMSKPLSGAVLDDLLELRVEIAETVDRVYRETGLPSAQALLNRIEFRKEPRSPWLGYSSRH
jgi:hypothetical protein